MTTLTRDNTMTLSNTLFANDDQQVPDNSVVVSARVKTATSQRPHLPDFTSLLVEAHNSTSLSTPDVLQDYLDLSCPLKVPQTASPSDTFMETVPAAGVYWEEAVSIYDGLPCTDIKENVTSQQHVTVSSPPQNVNFAALKPLEVQRPTSLPLGPSQALPPVQQHGLSPTSSTDSPLADPFMEQRDCEKVEKERDAICYELCIPRDPQKWSPSHVQKWVMHMCRNYNLPDCHGLMGLNGMMLCSFTKENFIERTSADIGECLFIELDWMKLATTSPMESLTYTDLTSTLNNPMVSSAAMPTFSSPCSSLVNTPSTTSTHSFMSSEHYSMTSQRSSSSSSLNPDIPTPVLDDYDVTKATMYQLNQEVEQQPLGSFLDALQQQQQPPPSNNIPSNTTWEDVTTTSCDSSLNSIDFSALGHGIKQEAMESEDDEDDDDDSTGENTGRRRYVSHSKHTIHLWQFLKNLLQSPEHYGSYIKWLNKSEGIFKIENSREVAKLWGQRKNRPAMNYDKLSRSIRQYYKKGIIKKTQHSKRLVYQFQPIYL